MITVTLQESAIRRFESTIHQSMFVLSALREAGVPVSGVLCAMYVTRGTLSQTYDDLMGVITWRWTR